MRSDVISGIQPAFLELKQPETSRICIGREHSGCWSCDKSAWLVLRWGERWTVSPAEPNSKRRFGDKRRYPAANIKSIRSCMILCPVTIQELGYSCKIFDSRNTTGTYRYLRIFNNIGIKLQINSMMSHYRGFTNRTSQSLPLKPIPSVTQFLLFLPKLVLERMARCLPMQKWNLKS